MSTNSCGCDPSLVVVGGEATMRGLYNVVWSAHPWKSRHTEHPKMPVDLR